MKFIKAYEREGIPIWGITVQNEPMATQTWESCIYSAEDERDFLKNHLGPTMKREGLGDRKIIVWDHNRDLIYQRVSTILDRPQGRAIRVGHRLSLVRAMERRRPDVRQRQARARDFPEQEPDLHRRLRRFVQGRRSPQLETGRSVRALDDQRLQRRRRRLDGLERAAGRTGRPESRRELCFAPVHADTRTGELTYTNSYYYIGHFSKFVRPGARRIASSPSRSALLSTAFVNPDGKVSVVVMNRGDQKIDYYPLG